MIANTVHVLAIEAYTAARALDLRLRQMPEARMGRGTAEAHRRIRAAVPYHPGDTWWGPEIARTRKVLAASDFLRAIAQATKQPSNHVTKQPRNQATT